MYSSPADSQHRLSGPDSKGMEIHCMCLCCSHTGHECFLPTAAEDIKKSMTHSSVVSDDGATDDGIVHNGCFTYPECALQLNMEDHTGGGQIYIDL